MENRFLSYIISATIVGILLSASTYYFFSDRKVDPRTGLSASVIEYEIPVFSLSTVFVKAFGIEQKDIPDIARKIIDYFSHSDIIYTEQYTIINNSDRKIDEIMVVPVKERLIKLIDRVDSSDITDSWQQKGIAILPGEARTIYAYYNRPEYGYRVKFLVEGKALEMPNFDSLAPQDDSFDTYFFMFLLNIPGLTGWIIVIGGIVTNYMTSKNPKLILSTTTSETIGLHLALLNYLRIENHEKYIKAIKHAEKKFDRWYNSSGTPSSYDI